MDISFSALLILYLSTGFSIGFGHCLGMCGPLVTGLVLNQKSKNLFFSQILYHFGRITTYSIIGGAMGAMGSFTAVATKIESFQKTMMIFSGLLIVLMGLATSGLLPKMKHLIPQFYPGQYLGKKIKQLLNIPSYFIFYLLGLLLGLIPCGPVYTALIGAARAGMDAQNIYKGTLMGMMLMAAFGLGTLPALLLTAKIAGIKSFKSKVMMYRLGSFLMIGTGIYFIVKGFAY